MKTYSLKFTWTAYFVLHCSKVDGSHFFLSSSTCERSVTSFLKQPDVRVMQLWCLSSVRGLSDEPVVSFYLWCKENVIHERTTWAESVWVIQDKSQWTFNGMVYFIGPCGEKLFFYLACLTGRSKVRVSYKMPPLKHKGLDFWLVLIGWPNEAWLLASSNATMPLIMHNFNP